MDVCRMKARRQLSWLQVGAIAAGRIVDVVHVVHVDEAEDDGDEEGKKEDDDVVDAVEDKGVVFGDVVMEEVVKGVVGEVFGVVDEVDKGASDTAVAFDMPTQAFQFSISSVQSVVIDSPSISTIVVFWPFIMRQIVMVTLPRSPLKGALPW